MTHRFFKTHHLSLEQKRAALLRAKELCYHWWVDILDCSKSWARQKVEMSFEDIMAKLTDQCHFVVVHRKLDPEDHIEIGFSTIDAGPGYFLWILVSREHLGELVRMI